MRLPESLSVLGSTIASLMFVWAIVRQYLPPDLERYFPKFSTKLTSLLYPFIEITFSEYTGERLKRSEAYTAIESYLTTTCTQNAKRLKGEMGKDSNNLMLTMDDHEEVTDEFRGARMWWASSKTISKTQSISFYPSPEGSRYYKLTFHRRHRDLVRDAYLSHVMEEGKAIGVRKRQRKLYTNNPSYDSYSYRKLMWSHVPLEHPSTFQTLAMASEKKREIMQDLTTFSKSKDYYARIGKPWKRGYLLYGPPGTGKSTMIAAMAKFLDYDIYDLELTAVKDNSALKKLLIETAGRSIIVIEDIDCTLDLSGKRKKSEASSSSSSSSEVEKQKPPIPQESSKEDSKVTLSGLLNFIDGLWSACGGERLIVFTTNHIEKLDPALIRRGRMDKHVELSFCRFEAFKVLAKNYLDIDEHPLFESIGKLMEETDITPADVAENLMPKAGESGAEAIDSCLECLIQALNECKTKSKEVEAVANEEEEG